MEQRYIYKAWKDWAGILLRIFLYIGGFLLLSNLVKIIVRDMI